MALGADDVIVATATDAQGNTSEFSFALLQSLAIIDDAPDPSIAGTPYSATVRAESTGTPFKPNGSVVISDGRGSSCVATFAPTSTANRSEGSCELVTAGAPGGISLTASYSSFASAFGTSEGGSIGNATAPHQVGAGAVAIEAADGANQYTPVGTAFASPLRVRVLAAGGVPFAGASVRFAAPSGAASAGLSAATVVSDANGIAEVLATANATTGRYSVNASVGGLTTSFMLNNDSILGSRCTGARSSVLGFRDDFAGIVVDPARWNVDVNDGSVTVGAGEATVNADNVVGFPYVTARRWPVASQRRPFVALDRHLHQHVGGLRQQQHGGIDRSGARWRAGGQHVLPRLCRPVSEWLRRRRADFDQRHRSGGVHLESAGTGLRREIEFCWLDGRDELWVDGVRVENPLRDPTLLRPDALWFGNFDRGVLPGEHPDFRLDLVEVRALEVGFDTDLQIIATTPNPSTPASRCCSASPSTPEPGAPAAPTSRLRYASTGERLRNCRTLPATNCSLSFATLGDRGSIDLEYCRRPAVPRLQVCAARSPSRAGCAPTLASIDDAAIAEGDSGHDGIALHRPPSTNPTGAAVSVQLFRQPPPDTATSPADFAANSGHAGLHRLARPPGRSWCSSPATPRSCRDRTLLRQPQRRDRRKHRRRPGRCGTITTDDAAPPFPVLELLERAAR